MSSRRRRRRIVVVDDDSTVLRAVQRQLDTLGWEAYPATTAAEALSLVIRVRDVEALLTDMNMPVMDGVALRDEVARRFPAIVVVFMSGASEAGTSDVLCKPFSLGALSAALDAVTARKE